MSLSLTVVLISSSSITERVITKCFVLCQAEDFNDAIEAIQEWLPLAEAELKFRSLPEDEDGLIRWIENHEVTY
jgi:hypothetical protein